MTDLKYKPTKDAKIIKMYRFIEVATAILVFVAIFFANHILTTELMTTEKFLLQNNIQTASNLKGRISNSIHEMETLSVKMSLNVNTFSKDEIGRFLEQHINDYDYHRLIFAYPNGHTIRYQKGKGFLPSIDWTQDPRFIASIKGEPAFITTEVDKEVRCGYVNSFSVPVRDKQGNIIGVLGSLIDAQNYLKILGRNNYDNKGLVFIIKRDGEFVYAPKNSGDKQNFFDRNIDYFALSKQSIKDLVFAKGAGTFAYKYDGSKNVAAFSKIGDSKFYVLTSVPLNVLMLNADKLLWGITSIVVVISLLLILLLSYSTKIFKENEKIIYDAAFTDTVTGLGNRNNFNLEAAKILKENQDKHYAMVYIDIKKFKAIEELYSDEFVNQILKDFIGIINMNLPDGSICARDYSASFIALHKCDSLDDIIDNFIKNIVNKTKEYNEKTMRLPSSTGAILSAKLNLAFGIYDITDHLGSVPQMCQRAETAKNEIKDNALQIYKIYDDKLRTQILADKEVEDEMYFALNDGQFKMFLQPKFSLQIGQVAGAEALVRWFHPNKGMIPPINFIPLFEKNGFVIEVDMNIWKQACEFIQERKAAGLKLFPISVNVSRLHLNNDSFIDELVRLIGEYGIEPKYLELEVTESACFNNEQRFMDVLNKLKEFGFTISMDDFGTGYSSLNMLRHLPIDVLKLDRGFIKDTISDTKGQIVTTSIIEMANKLNITTVSEGIETTEQANFLRTIGCKIAQGFLYGKPVSTPDFKSLFLSDESNIYDFKG